MRHLRRNPYFSGHLFTLHVCKQVVPRCGRSLDVNQEDPMNSQFSRRPVARIMYIVALALASATFSFAASGTWSPTGTMRSARDGHTATILANGRILVAGGTNNGFSLTSAELYNPT